MTEERPKNMPMNPDYVIAYTPGKVGSTTIMHTLATVGVPCHRCSDYNIGQYHKRDWPTISAVREPIEWLFSRIFEQWKSREFYPTEETPEQVVQAIQDNGVFYSWLMDYCNWWATSFRQTVGVNIYGLRWRKKDNYAIYSKRALVLRTDKFDEVMETALGEFLPQYYPDIDMSTLEVQHRAKGVDRFEGYEEFLSAVKFDRQWLANFYDKTPMCRYFFYAKELQEWIKKWSKRV